MTSNLYQRMGQHTSGNGSVATNKNKIVPFSHIYQDRLVIIMRQNQITGLTM